MSPLKLITFLALLMLPLSALAEDKLVLYRTTDAKATYTWAVAMSRLQQTPAWTAASGTPPPFSIAQAVAIATRQLKAANPAFKRYDVLSISLVAASGTDDQPPGHWYYRIALVPVVNGNRLYRLQYVAVVLLDGALVEPQVEEGGKH